MNKIYIKVVEQLIELRESIISIAIENPINYRNMVYNLRNELIYSENNSPLDIDKHCLIVYNPFELNINDAKLIKLMYKKMEKSKNDEFDYKFSHIIEELKVLIYELSYNLETSIEMNNEIDLQKILSALNVQFTSPPIYSFLENFVNYFKIYKMFSPLNVVFTFGLLSLLNDEEICQLRNEMSVLELNIVDFSIQKKNTVTTLIIDDDWCII